MSLAAAEAVALPNAEPLIGALPVPLPEALPLSPVPRALLLGLPRKEGVDVPLWVPIALAVGAPPLPVPFALPLAEALPPPPPSAVAVGEAPVPEGLVWGEGVSGAPLGEGVSLQRALGVGDPPPPLLIDAPGEGEGATREPLGDTLLEALAPAPLGVPSGVSVETREEVASALALAAAAVPLAEARAEVLPLPRPPLRDGDTERPPLLEAVALPSALAVPCAVPEGAAAEGVRTEVAESNCEKVGGATVGEPEGLAASVREAVAVALPVGAAERVPSPPLCVAKALPAGVPVTSGEEVAGASETLVLAL